MTKSYSGIVALVGRLCISVIFLTSAYSKMFGWDGNVAYVATRHITSLAMVDLMLGGALIIELVGGICLIVGLQARIAAFAMALYMAAVNVIFHNYWAFTGLARGANATHFEKNLAILGGLLMVTALGSGPFSLTREKS